MFFVFLWLRSCLQVKHQQQRRVAAEEPGRILLPPLHPGHSTALPRLFSRQLYIIFDLLNVCRPVDHQRHSQRVLLSLQLDSLSQLTTSQLAEMAATPGLLTSPDQVAMVMGLVPDQMFASFFDDFSAAITVGKHHA